MKNNHMINSDQNKIKELLKIERSTPVFIKGEGWNAKTEWRLPNGQIHRDFGPAVIWERGDKTWIKNGKLHREDGPAVSTCDGYEAWFKDGKCHREDGPAVVHDFISEKHIINYTTYYINGREIKKADFEEWKNKSKLGKLIQKYLDRLFISMNDFTRRLRTIYRNANSRSWP